MQATTSISSMQDLEHKSDEELANETRHRAAAQAILGARAAQRYEAELAKEHFRPRDRRGPPAGADADSSHGRRLDRAR